jgi:hypothetical protein
MSASDRTVSGIPIDAVYGGGPGVPDGLPPPPENTNERFRHLLREGQTGLSVAFDMPTLMGYDPDHLLSEGEPRSWAERADPKLIHFNRLDKGRHFAAWEAPDSLPSEVRTAFRSLR